MCGLFWCGDGENGTGASEREASGGERVRRSIRSPVYYVRWLGLGLMGDGVSDD